MVEDVVRALGYLCLGTRLKRIGERLQSDTQRILLEFDSTVGVSQYPFLAALDRLGPLTIGELAEAVGISQPGVTRGLSPLLALGLVRAEQPDSDQRRRVVHLTDCGRDLVAAAKREAWPRIERAVAELCAALDGPLLTQLAAIEDGLAEAPLDRRTRQSETSPTAETSPKAEIIP